MNRRISFKAVNTNYLILSLIIFISLIIISSLPREYLFSKSTICLHYRIFGIQCPFCGGLRAVYCFLHLEFAASIKYNYNVILLALLLPVIVTRIFSSSPWALAIEKVILIMLAFGFSLIYIIRLANLV
jgi:hypothetical protein